MKRGLLLLAAGMLLSGCLDVDSTIALNRDGSGTINIEYRIDPELYHLGVFDDSDAALPIPVSRAAFVETADGIRGLKLRRYRLVESDNAVTVQVRLGFTSVEALDEWYGAGESAVSLSRSGGETVFTVLITPGGASGARADAFAQSLDGHTVSYRIETPAPITTAAPGAVSDNRREAVLTISLHELATADGPLIWEVRW